ncbi:MAG: hypothetical protein MUC59_14410 [Saprospiraceae bacterium]|nr:hypothetical protein [Saprospiraceae bacterium]
MANGVSLLGGFNGTETTANQRNPTTNVTTLSADVNGDDTAGNFTTNRTDNSRHVIVTVPITGSQPSIIDGFTISGGNTGTDGTDLNKSGGGIFAFNKVEVSNCKFTDNFGSTGSAIFLMSSAANSSIVSCDISDNLGSGALYLRRSNGVTVDSVKFTGNVNNTGTTNAAALFAFNCTDIAITYCDFIDNQAPSAGALYFTADSLPAVTAPYNFVLQDCKFIDNTNTLNNGTSLGVGGAARFRNCSYAMVNCVFDNSNSQSSGGHIRNDNQADDNVVYTNCEFKKANSGGWGGAITAYGGDFTFTNCTFEENTCARLGGAVNNGFAGTMTYVDCTFLNNKALGTASGGALALQNDGTKIFAVGCEFIGNTTEGNGGAIFSGAADSSSPVSVDNCSFEGNSAMGVGGAIAIADNGPSNNSTLDVSNCYFNFNSGAEQGGAINISDATTNITSCLFTNNIATSGSSTPTGRGGAISINVDSTELEVNITNNTFAYNIGEYAAAISNWTGAEDVSFSTTTLLNNIFVQDGFVNYAIEAGAPTVTSLGGNLYDDDSFDDILTHVKDLKVDDISDLFVDADNDDYSLQNNAVAVDAGVSTGAPTLDILGNPRVDEVDMGAYENQFVSNDNEVVLENNGLLTISPNPAAGAITNVTLATDWVGAVQVRLVNSVGQIVQLKDMDKSGGPMLFELPINELPNGVYHLAMSNGNQVVVAQLVRIKH